MSAAINNKLTQIISCLNTDHRHATGNAALISLVEVSHDLSTPML